MDTSGTDLAPKDYLSAREAAAMLGVTARTVHLWIVAGKLPATRVSERVTRIPRAAVREMISPPVSSIQDRGVPTAERAAVFWDVDVESLDPERHARFIIERILEAGRPVHLRWLFSTYPVERILEVARTSRGLSHKAASAWTNILEARIRDVA
ncbi:MAG: helix-turn-helix domain-containing protein [Coriobacteriia bacterium]|nr:helix-turn-helix domain-containing protein [Coriobacteriia bacterium]